MSATIELFNDHGRLDHPEGWRPAQTSILTHIESQMQTLTQQDKVMLTHAHAYSQKFADPHAHLGARKRRWSVATKVLEELITLVLPNI